MRVVIQRVQEANVKVDGVIIGSIQKGVAVLVGIENDDNMDDVNWLSNKIVHMRIFDDAEGVMNLSLQDIGGAILCISQFTLQASTKKGNRPSYIKAAKPEVAVPLYKAFVEALGKDLGQPIQTGKFGADMKVSFINDGPVTIIMDSKNKE